MRESQDRRIELIERLLRTNRELALRLREVIHKYVNEIKRKYGQDVRIRIMNFCGTHEWTTVYYGLRTLVPREIELVAGPGCPVCITPSRYVELCIKLCIEEGFRVYTYGDTYRVPTIRAVHGARSLAEAHSLGGDVVVVYSFLEAIKHFLNSDRKRSVFLGIGFETVAPAYALMFMEGKVPQGFYFLSVVRLTPPAAIYTIEKCRERLRCENVLFGIIAPGHVSTVTGAGPWSEISGKFNIPVVVSGFEPIDVLMSICEILRQLLRGEAKTVIEYKRAVTWHGNVHAKNIMAQVFDIVDATWRGIGIIPQSGLELNDKYAQWDIVRVLNLQDEFKTWTYDLPAGCKCGEIMLGLAYPTDCPLFLKACTPQRPIGPCMVSSEGTCAIWAKYGSTLMLQELAQELNIE